MGFITNALIVIFVFFILIILSQGIVIIRPVERGLVERFGKYVKTFDDGLHIVIPIVYQVRKINITERMVDVQPQTVITKDKLNAEVDAVVYFKVKDPQAAEYNVDNHENQLASLTRTTLRAVIGKMTLTEANENRDEINSKIEEILTKETQTYGVDILRVEIQRIEPPQDVQEAMNKVVKAEQEKIAAKDLAKAKETEADGDRMAEVKRAEGQKQAAILAAEGQAQAIERVAEAEAKKVELVNTAIREHFKDSAVDYKKLDTAREALKDGTKVIVDPKTDIVNVVSDAVGVTPIPVSRSMDEE